MFFIKNTTNSNLFWNNENGWVDFDSADSFSVEEQRSLNLPNEGEWISAWEVDTVQFARFIDECQAAGIFDDDESLSQVAESMDLEIDEVYNIIDRAMSLFQRIKDEKIPK